MGAFLDSAKNVRQDKKTASWQAHKIKKKLEKDEDEGVKMMDKIIDTRGITTFLDDNLRSRQISRSSVNLRYTTQSGEEQVSYIKYKTPSENVHGERLRWVVELVTKVPIEMQFEVATAIMAYEVLKKQKPEFKF